jgi:SAM-dependent methyltransferase
MSEPDHARSFGEAAERYDRFRPGYADEAITWAVGERPLRVADLGAGTGILSRGLRDLGHDVVAVEPDGQMRARLEAASPGVVALAGTAEEIPLPDGSVDAVVAGQAYHWFDPERAHAEIARVLRPGGVFAALRNDADPGAPWTVRFTQIIDGPLPTDDEPTPAFGDAFGPVTRAVFAHELWLTADDLVGLATTRSPYLVAVPERRREMEAEVRGLIAREFGGRGRFAMPHLTRVYRAARIT